MELLNVEMSDGDHTTLVGELMAARKKYHRVKVTDSSICLGVMAELGNSTEIEAAIASATNIAERFEFAASNSE
jgi:hypothetical protein